VGFSDPSPDDSHANCNEVNMDVYLHYPDPASVQTLVVTNENIAATGTPGVAPPGKLCNGTAGQNDPPCVAFATTYKIKATDVNKELTIHLPRLNTDVHSSH